MSTERMPEPAASTGAPLPSPRSSSLGSGALGWRREVAGFATAVIAGPLLSWMLFALRSQESITYEVLSFQLLVVVVAIIGGLRPAVFTAVLSGITLDLLFVAPVFTIAIDHPLHVVALALYVIIAVLVGLIVVQAANRARAARRATAEAELLVSVAGNVLRGDNAVLALVTRTREAFGLSGVRLIGADGEVLARDGEPVRDSRATTIPVGRGADGEPRALLELHGGPLDAPSRRLLDVIVAQLSAAIEHTDLSATAREAEALAETDQVRSALLSALSHDLRRPLAAAVAAIGGLRGTHRLTASDRDELLATADESLSTLSRLITDLLDVSRVQAGVLAVSATRVDAEGSILSALDELSLGPDDVELALDPDLPGLHADPGLLQRVLVNLLANALAYSPAGSRVTVAAHLVGGRAELRIIDRGAGVPPERQSSIFQPFQRYGDTDNTTGLGLGLALSKGFTEGMGGRLTPEDTPAGGLTMVISLPLFAGSPDTHEAE
ncbi:ATP-binding protein [Microbacterium sp. AK031]|uniref:sensor histidine kinase n=1 Tax=Microbacterium sp. AK031 TaxID=2723076 RepID=UPI0037C5A5AC|nr:two-component system sensor histidine kinase KdpD [Microbacterium sp. AK031]